MFYKWVLRRTNRCWISLWLVSIPVFFHSSLPSSVSKWWINTRKSTEFQVLSTPCWPEKNWVEGCCSRRCFNDFLGIPTWIKESGVMIKEPYGATHQQAASHCSGKHRKIHHCPNFKNKLTLSVCFQIMPPNSAIHDRIVFICESSL